MPRPGRLTMDIINEQAQRIEGETKRAELIDAPAKKTFVPHMDDPLKFPYYALATRYGAELIPFPITPALKRR